MNNFFFFHSFIYSVYHPLLEVDWSLVLENLIFSNKVFCLTVHLQTLWNLYDWKTNFVQLLNNQLLLIKLKIRNKKTHAVAHKINKFSNVTLLLRQDVSQIRIPKQDSRIMVQFLYNLWIHGSVFQCDSYMQRIYPHHSILYSLIQSRILNFTISFIVH